MTDLAAFFHNELHDGRDIFIRNHDKTSDYRLADFLDHTWIRKLIGVVDTEEFAIRAENLIDHRRVGGDDVHVKFPAQTLQNDFHMKEAEESTTEAEA